MTIDDQIRDEKLQYDINRKAAEISALSSGKIDKYEYLTGEEILPSNQKQIIERAKSTYSPLGKAFEKQIKTIEDQGKSKFRLLILIAGLNRSQKDKKRKNDVFDSLRSLYKVRELVINAFKSRLFPIKSTTGTGRK